MEIFSAAGNVTEVVSLPTPKKSWYGGRVRKGPRLSSLVVMLQKSGCRCQHLANQHDLDEMAPPVDSLNAHDAPIQWIRADLG